jgi:hypothetical protein
MLWNQLSEQKAFKAKEISVYSCSKKAKKEEDNS